jgi:hypothetical protein
MVNEKQKRGVSAPVKEALDGKPPWYNWLGLRYHSGLVFTNQNKPANYSSPWHYSRTAAGSVVTGGRYLPVTGNNSTINGINR